MTMLSTVINTLRTHPTTVVFVTWLANVLTWFGTNKEELQGVAAFVTLVVLFLTFIIKSWDVVDRWRARRAFIDHTGKTIKDYVENQKERGEGAWKDGEHSA